LWGEPLVLGSEPLGLWGEALELSNEPFQSFETDHYKV
jgi:hypothetical protein